ncbi:hypothetical protein BDR07DRAFT_1305131 [Suillus spraguei]|nr:hypothetical protein BDR07DRAFT_1305131 [Suillus spraguei]
MPLIAEDSNLAVIPDFRTEEQAAAWAHLTNDTIYDDQAAELLANLWAARLEEERCTAEANCLKSERRISPNMLQYEMLIYLPTLSSSLANMQFAAAIKVCTLFL